MLKGLIKNRPSKKAKVPSVKTVGTRKASLRAAYAQNNIFVDAHHQQLQSHHNPFKAEPSQPNQRWLLTTCLASIAGSVIIGAAVLGVFGESESGGQAMASVQPNDISQQPTATTTKGDLNGDVNQALQLRPYWVNSVAFRKGEYNNNNVSSLALLPEKNNTITPDSLYPGLEQASLGYMPGGSFSSGTKVLDSRYQSSSYDGNITTIAKTPPPEPVDETFALNAGETIADRLKALGVAADTAQSLAKAMEPVYPAKLIRTGQKFTITLDNQQDFYGNYVLYPVQLSFAASSSEEITIEADDEGQFVARVESISPAVQENLQMVKAKRKPAEVPQQFRVSGKVSSTLYAKARDLGVPKNVISEMIRAFSYDVDFQRQVRRGDSFELFYGMPLSGSSKKRKVMHYAKLNYGGKSKTYYRYTTKKGRTGYYDSKGHSANRSLMRTPISGARISSGFGLRRHPVLGYTKMHTGIDFAVPRNTPIRAAGDGVAIHVKRKGAYGRTVMIKHDNGYTTLYAHMQRYAKGLRQGQKVRQGQVIGYVGTSGRSTGPHLHYEVRRKNKPINPKLVRSSGSAKLSKAEMRKFKTQVKKIAALMKKAPTNTKVADAK